MPTLEECKNYLGIDYADEMIESRLKSVIKVADAFLKGAIGEDYPADDERAKEIALAVIGDMYDNRGNSEKVQTTTRRMIDNFILQLKCEMR